MIFELILDMSLINDFYGDIPETFTAPASAFECFEWPLEDQELLAADFVEPINDLCGTNLDIYDVDWFDAHRSVLLAGWLSERLQKPCTERLHELYTVLLDYATRAVELGTGIVVEL